MQAKQHLRRAFEDFLVEEVKRHDGIPELSDEEANFRASIAILLEEGPPPPKTKPMNLQRAAKDTRKIQATEEEVLLIFVHAMQFCMRIIRNCGYTFFNGKLPDELMLEGIIAMIRIIQVQIGSGRQELPEFSEEEVEEMRRIS